MVKNKKYNQIYQIAILSLSLVFIFLAFSQSSFCQKYSGNDLNQLAMTLEQSKYSGFQQNMVLDTVQELLSLGVDCQELNKVLIASIANHYDAYNIKKMLEILVDAKKNGISEIPLINKIKEGLAKKVEERIIIDALLKETGNLKVAKRILKDHAIEGSYSEQGMIEELADGLNNGIPQETMDEVLSRSVEQGKNIEEITEISEELSNLSLRAYEIGFSEEEVFNVFQKVLQTRTEIEEICEDIQDILIGAAAAKMTIITSNNSSGVSGQVNSSSTTTGESAVAVTETSGVIGSSGSGISSTPTDSDDQPDMETNLDDNDTSSSPPEN